MTAVGDATQLLNNANISGIDNIYPFFIPQNKQMATNTTDVLVTDVGEDYEDYGSNRATTTSNVVAVNIYKGSKTKESLDTIDNAIVSFFERNKWTVIYSGPIQIDPTTYQKFKTYQFKEFKERRN